MVILPQELNANDCQHVPFPIYLHPIQTDIFMILLPFLTYLKILSVFSVIFLLAGFFLKRIFAPGLQGLWADHLLYSFGFNLPVLVFAGILTLEWHRNAWWALALLLILQFILAFLALVTSYRSRGMTRPPAPSNNIPQPASHLCTLIAFLTLAILSYFYYRIGGFMTGGVPLGEEASHLGIMRKLAENPVLYFDNFFYRPHLLTSYLYAPYHLAMAMASNLLGLDVLVVYSKFRCFTVILLLLFFFSASHAVFKNQQVAWCSTFLAAGFLFFQIWGDVPEHYWGQLAPTAYPTDFAAGLVMPCAFTFLIHSLNERKPWKNFSFLKASILTGALAVIHTREAFYLIFYAVFLLFGILFFKIGPGKKEALIKLSGFLGFSALFIGIFFVRRWFFISGTTHQEVIRRANLFQELKRLLDLPYAGLFHADALQPYREQAMLLFGLGGWFLAAILLLPFLLFFRRQNGPVILFSIIFLFLLLFRFPITRIFMSLLSYSEIWMITPRLISFWCYIILGGLFSLMVATVAQRFFLIFPAAIFMFFVPAGVRVLSKVVLANPDRVFLWILPLSLVIWVLGFIPAFRKIICEFPVRQLPLSRILPISFLLICFSGFSFQRPNLWEQYQTARSKLNMTDAGWYASTSLNDIFPQDLITFIREQIPIHSVFVYDPKYTYFLPMLSNQFIVSAGYLISEETEYTRQYLRLKGDRTLEVQPTDDFNTRMRKYFQLYDRHMKLTSQDKPIFNFRDSAQEIEYYVQGMGIDYLLIHPEHYGYLIPILSTRSKMFKKIYDQNHYAIFEVQIREPSNKNWMTS